MKKNNFLFPYQRYIQVLSYFNFYPKGENLFWVNYDKLTLKEKDLIAFDNNYSSHASSLLDAAYQARFKGIVFKDVSCSLNISSLNLDVTIDDNYRFIKKFHHRSWIYFVFLIRVFSMTNIIQEFRAIKKVMSIKKISLFYPKNDQTEYKEYVPEASSSERNISIIIPTLGRYSYLKNLLADISQQKVFPEEIIIIDQNVPPDKEFYKLFTSLPLKVIYQKEKGVWTARNVGIKISKGENLLFIDDDSRVGNEWIKEHLKALAYFNASVSAGISESKFSNDSIPEYFHYLRWADEMDLGNVLIKKEVFQQIGLFDLQFNGQRLGDIEFGLRTYLNGIKSISNPFAKRTHLYASSGGLRNFGYWNPYKPVNFFKPRPAPSVIYYTRKYFHVKNLAILLIRNIPLSFLPMKRKKQTKGKLLIYFLFLIPIAPLLFINLYRSFMMANRMLKEGGKIEQL